MIKLINNKKCDDNKEYNVWNLKKSELDSIGLDDTI